jgi:hypothetical protein
MRKEASSAKDIEKKQKRLRRVQRRSVPLPEFKNPADTLPGSKVLNPASLTISGTGTMAFWVG